MTFIVYMRDKINLINLYISSVFAGICISIGCTVNLLVDNKYIGALLFSFGLLTILSYNLDLYTGKICYLLDKGVDYLDDLITIWVGNVGGALLTAFILEPTRIYNTLNLKANKLVELKGADSLPSLFFLGTMCGICLYIAVIQYNSSENISFKNIFIVIMSVSIFVICGFEHSIADMFYALIANNRSFDFPHIIVITLGNSFGSMLCAYFHRLIKT